MKNSSTNVQSKSIKRVKSDTFGSVDYSKNYKNLNVGFGGSVSCICENSSATPYSANKNSTPNHKSATEKKKNISFRIEDLLMVSKPAKCCRKAHLYEQPRTAIPYHVSLMSLHLDDKDVEVINMNIGGFTEFHSKFTCCARVQVRNYHLQKRIFQVMYFELKLDKAIQSYPIDLTQYIYLGGEKPSTENKEICQFYKRAKSKGKNAFLQSPIYNTMYHFKGPTFQIIKKKSYDRLCDRT